MQERLPDQLALGGEGVAAPGRQDRIDMTSLLNALLGAGVRIETVPVGGDWWEFDSEEDVRAYERLTRV